MKASRTIHKQAPATLHTVAAVAGVSTATVSRVLSGSPLVRPETATQVQKVIDQLQFVPNASATALKFGRSDLYGIIMANVTNPFFMEFLRDFDSLLVGGRQAILVANAENHLRVASSVHSMLKNQVDGVIVMISDEEFGPNYDRFSLRDIPAITIDRRTAAPMVSDISFDYEDGMLQAISHLLELGHERIGFIGGTEGFRSSLLRRAAFEFAMKQRNLMARAEWLVSGDYLMEGGDAQIRRLMALPDRPTAVMCINDMTAIGALRAAQLLGLSVPADVSIVGCDDITLAAIVSPALSTLRLPRRRVAQACLECFAEMSKFPEAHGPQLLLETELIVRSSTAKAPDK
jgi:DNA-binding LacI/PurR family transcriptional regulator